MIYRFLAESDAEYATFLHNEGYTAGAKRFKLFTFSQLMRRILDDNIHFGSTITWYVSSPVERFFSHFADYKPKETTPSFGFGLYYSSYDLSEGHVWNR
ncbi:MAG: hypothetical protein OXH00_16865 [Candidatus Poribacteria bacterium]|nr:hypothetical protein [Candidatus Poribacteria bacterium]